MKNNFQVEGYRFDKQPTENIYSNTINSGNYGPNSSFADCIKTQYLKFKNTE